MTTPATIPQLRGRAQAIWPGLLVCAVVAAAASFLAGHYGAPATLFALLLGLALNFLSSEGRCTPGIDVAARRVLRIGVALLGLRITAGQVAELGFAPVAIVVASVALTIGVSMLAAKLMGFQSLFGLLTGGATAICGVSAALALSAALPAHPLKERATLFTVIGISALSTLSMIVYPALVHVLGLDARTAGIFLGGTIHDVAQVVGAGYAVSREAGDAATVVKLMRVAMLVPVIAFAVALARRRAAASAARVEDTPATKTARAPLLPAFVVAFVVLVVLNSLGAVPQAVREAGSDVSRWCLLIAVAAIGTKTRFQELLTVGLKPVVLMVGETLFLAALVLAALRFVH